MIFLESLETKNWSKESYQSVKVNVVYIQSYVTRFICYRQDVDGFLSDLNSPTRPGISIFALCGGLNHFL